MTGAPARAPSRLNLAQRLGVGAVVLLALVAAALGSAGWAYYRQVQAGQHLINVVDKARLEAQALLSDYVNEETGVRGYILSHQESFLQPWYLGLSNALTDRLQLGVLEAKEPGSARLLAGVDTAARAWQDRFAEPAIAATAKRDYSFASTAMEDAGKGRFDVVRQRFTALENSIDASDAASRATLSGSEGVVTWAFVVLVLILALAGAAAWWGLQAWVTRPLGQLQRDVRQVAGGGLDHRVDKVGPPDLAALARDVDLMRERIVSELRSLSEARDSLSALNSDLSRSNQELEQFAYVASHDLQEPLRKVVSFCQLLSTRYAAQLDDRAREYIAYAVDGATRMQTLINDLLALSRVGRATSQFTDVDLNEALGHAVGNLETAIREKKAEVVVGPLPTVRGDLALLTALFQNLIANAIKFNESPVPVVEISARPDKNGCEISFSDNGIGIEPRFADRVFVVFQRLHSREAYTGTGIGLAMAKKIVEFHGGHIWVDPQYSPGPGGAQPPHGAHLC